MQHFFDTKTMTKTEQVSALERSLTNGQLFISQGWTVVGCSSDSSFIVEVCFHCVCLQLSVVLDTAAVQEELKPYLSLFLEVLFESPILRDGGMVRCTR